jgi:ABC-type sulfate transport system permease component
MSTPKGAKDVRLRRAIIAFAVIVALAVITPFAIRSTQTSQRDLDRSLRSIQQTR